jgi:hypothetical protein
MRHDSHSDTAAARTPSLRGRTQVIQPEDLVWPPPLEDLQAFSVIKVGEDDERTASLLIVAGVAAAARPQPVAAAPVPTWPRNAVRPGDVTPAHAPVVSSRSMLRRWMWLGLLVAVALTVF